MNLTSRSSAAPSVGAPCSWSSNCRARNPPPAHRHPFAHREPVEQGDSQMKTAARARVSKKGSTPTRERPASATLRTDWAASPNRSSCPVPHSNNPAAAKQARGSLPDQPPQAEILSAPTIQTSKGNRARSTQNCAAAYGLSDASLVTLIICLPSPKPSSP